MISISRSYLRAGNLEQPDRQDRNMIQSKSRSPGDGMLSDRQFGKLLAYFDRPFEGYRKVRGGVKKRIRRRMAQLRCTDMEDYLRILDEDPQEKTACENCLTVTISRFFRDRRLWEYLRTTVLPDAAERSSGRVDIWSAGCANGEEAYSLALLWDMLGIDTRLHITATDLDTDNLERARLGVYELSSLKELSGSIRIRYFSPLPGERGYRIQPELTKSIRWLRHNMFDPPPEGPFHVVFLRNNLLTYYQGAELETALARITKTMAPRGYLVIGSHERLPENGFSFRRHEECPFVYQLPE